jgi:hypothetical protein
MMPVDVIACITMIMVVTSITVPLRDIQDVIHVITCQLHAPQDANVRSLGVSVPSPGPAGHTRPGPYPAAHWQPEFQSHGNAPQAR